MSEAPDRTTVTLVDAESGDLVFDVLTAGPTDGPAGILLHGLIKIIQGRSDFPANGMHHADGIVGVRFDPGLVQGGCAG